MDEWREYVMRRGTPLDPEALTPAIRRAVMRVQADIRATTDIPWEWAFVNDPDPVRPATECWIGTAYGGAYGPAVRWDTDEEDAVVYLADEWSEKVCETLALGDVERARRWPPCPRSGHDHALDPELHHDEAVWVCRRDRIAVATIGQLVAADD